MSNPPGEGLHRRRTMRSCADRAPTCGLGCRTLNLPSAERAILTGGGGSGRRVECSNGLEMAQAPTRRCRCTVRMYCKGKKAVSCSSIASTSSDSPDQIRVPAQLEASVLHHSRKLQARPRKDMSPRLRTSRVSLQAQASRSSSAARSRRRHSHARSLYPNACQSFYLTPQVSLTLSDREHRRDRVDELISVISRTLSSKVGACSSGTCRCIELIEQILSRPGPRRHSRCDRG